MRSPYLGFPLAFLALIAGTSALVLTGCEKLAGCSFRLLDTKSSTMTLQIPPGTSSFRLQCRAADVSSFPEVISLGFNVQLAASLAPTGYYVSAPLDDGGMRAPAGAINGTDIGNGVLRYEQGGTDGQCCPRLTAGALDFDLAAPPVAGGTNGTVQVDVSAQTGTWKCGTAPDAATIGLTTSCTLTPLP